MSRKMTGFEQHHIDVINFIKAGDQAALHSEESIFNEYVNCVSDNTERLEQLEDLVVTTKPLMPHASDKGDGRPGSSKDCT